MDEMQRPIGVFDSGVGGISVLRELVALMPNENFIFYGDSKNAPYGTKTLEEVRTLTLSDAEYLMKQNVKALVVACNTATSAAIHILREKYQKEIPVIGIEPALKPAALCFSSWFICPNSLILSGASWFKSCPTVSTRFLKLISESPPNVIAML